MRTWMTAARLTSFETTSDPAAILATYGPEPITRLQSLVERYDPNQVMAAADPIHSIGLT